MMRRIIPKLIPKEEYVMQWHTNAGNITNILKVKLDFTLLEFSATENCLWNGPVNDSVKNKYDVILGRYLLTEL